MSGLRQMVLAAFVAAAVCLWPATAAAEICVSVSVSQITGPKYAEVEFFTGSVRGQNGVLPVRAFANGLTGTWTIMVMVDKNIGCIIAAGINFKPPQKPMGRAL